MDSLFKLPPQCADDPQMFRRQIERYRSGAISAAELRAYRVPLGVYEQRESDTYMLRVRFPGGVLLPHQLRALAEVARRFGTGILHVTTRQDIQVHRVALDDVPAAFELLYEAGLSPRGGGGNTVRNITACSSAGVCPEEQFDVTGHAAALTEFMLPDPLSYQLPRKYKIAFSGCRRDCAGATVNDLGLIATRRNGTEGFTVYVAGGLGASSRVADLLEPFVAADSIHLVAEAVKRVFDKHGNRKNRHRARLRFLAEEIGLERLRELYRAELEALAASGPSLPPRPVFRPPSPPAPTAALAPRDSFARWRRRNTSPQKQAGFHQAIIPLWLGDIPAERLEQLADLVARFGEGALRSDPAQNLLVRWIPTEQLPEVHARLEQIGLGAALPPVLRNLVSCTGAATCRLGICRSRGLANAIRNALQEASWDLDILGELRIHISGCPNCCGRHRIGNIGLYGAARRTAGRLVPHYVIQLGGQVAEGSTALAEGDRAVPARNVPALLVELLDAYRRQRGNGSFRQFAETAGHTLLEELADRYQQVPPFDRQPEYYHDWDAEEPFSLAGRGPGECSAGVFDLIEVDLASAEGALREKRLLDAVVLASRALLITQGQQADNPVDALQLFLRCFVEQQLVDQSLRAVVEQAQQAILADQPADALAASETEVAALVGAVRRLYENMDPSLRFTPVGKPAAATAGRAPAGERQPAERSSDQPHREVDFRGVACPLNYVKTKMALDRMESGQVLSVLLDEAGSRNVPESVAKDGHRVLAVEQRKDHWQVLIRKL